MARTKFQRPPLSRSVTVERGPDHFYSFADTAIVTTSPSGFYEVAFVVLNMKIASQRFAVIAKDEQGETLQNPETEAAPSITEMGVVRLAPAVAIESAATMLLHAIQTGTPREEVLGALRAKGIVE